MNYQRIYGNKQDMDQKISHKPLPCIDCVTLSICKAIMNDEGNNNLLCRFMIVIDRCELLKNYMNRNVFRIEPNDIQAFMNYMVGVDINGRYIKDVMYYNWKMKV
jgi:hypothetical protein